MPFWVLPVLAVLLAPTALFLGACSTGDETMQSFSEDGISFRYPHSWYVSGFSTTNLPQRLAVTSYPVPSDAVEGDCGGHRAVERLPSGGALVLLVDYGERSSLPPQLRPARSFPDRPVALTMGGGEFSDYECFGPSTMFRFRIGKRHFQAHVAVGPTASDKTRARALAILAALAVDETTE